MQDLTKTNCWQALVNHQRTIDETHMRDWFANDATRFDHFSLQQQGLFLDYSRNRITETTINLLIALAENAGLASKIDALFKGEPINNTENRPALHTALRDQSHTPILLDGENIAAAITAMRAQMATITEAITTGAWRGISGKAIRHVVNIGIGGSYLGPLMTTTALSAYAKNELTFHFISTVDQAQLEEIWQCIDPHATLFIISSKSYTTLETATNAATIIKRMQAVLGQPDNQRLFKHHFLAITANIAAAKKQGIPQENILPLWKWIGGRYSIWSAIGLPLMLMLGVTQFNDFLQGAYEMDEHVRHAPFAHNMPVLLALLSIWYSNFFHASTQAIIPYSHRLRYLIPYLQQADMESNGKSVNQLGERCHYQTGSVIFGLEGCDGQHTYHQLLHQGHHLIPVDFILIAKPTLHKEALTEDIYQHHLTLFASGLSQAQALMRGKTTMEAYQHLRSNQFAEIEAAQLAEHQTIAGNKPSNILLIDELNPRHVGALIALYEHKIFVQGMIWNINPFDQWGVELGKQLLPSILNTLQQDNPNDTNDETDNATHRLINQFKRTMGTSCQ